MKLSDLAVGDMFTVNEVTLGGEIGKRLVDMGFSNGVIGEMVRCALFGDPIAVRIMGYDLSLRKSEAAGIEVEWISCRFSSYGHHRRRNRMGRGGKRGRHFPV